MMRLLIIICWPSVFTDGLQICQQKLKKKGKGGLFPHKQNKVSFTFFLWSHAWSHFPTDSVSECRILNVYKPALVPFADFVIKHGYWLKIMALCNGFTLLYWGRHKRKRLCCSQPLMVPLRTANMLKWKSNFLLQPLKIEAENSGNGFTPHSQTVQMSIMMLQHISLASNSYLREKRKKEHLSTHWHDKNCLKFEVFNS